MGLNLGLPASARGSPLQAAPVVGGGQKSTPAYTPTRRLDYVALSDHRLPSPRTLEANLEEPPVTPPPTVFGIEEGCEGTTPTQPSRDRDIRGQHSDIDCGISDPRTGSLSGRLKRFAKKVLKKAATPLLPTKVFDSSSKMPLRSSRIAAHPLSKVPVAKRGEILIMQRLGLAPAAGLADAQQKLDAMFAGNAGDAHAEAMRYC